jgi:glutathione S-transferase
MAEVIVHTIPGSPFARAVLATLEEKGVSWQIAPIKPNQLREPAHLSRNPFGRMPAVEHGDFMLYETQAVVRYIDRVWPQPALTPTDARLAARMDQVMNINDWYLFQGCGNIIGFQRVVGPRVLGLPQPCRIRTGCSVNSRGCWERGPTLPVSSSRWPK